jgi:hypothetical protein
VSVHFGGATCIKSTPASAFTATQIQCTLANAPRAGDHKVEVRDSKGLVPVANIPDITILLVVDSVLPSLANALGGDTLTITGSGFPISKDFVSVSLSTADGETSCIVKTTSET